MDLGINSNARPVGTPQKAAQRPGGSAVKSDGGRRKSPKKTLWIVVAAVAAVLIVAAAACFVIKSKQSEVSKVDKDKYQAVFLGDGQVYFGKLTSLNNSFLELEEVFYLNVGNSSEGSENTNTNVALVKLGCEIHGPEDRMVINRSTLTFWENLKDSAQVSSAIKQWKAENPNGQDCSAAANSNSQQQAKPESTPQQSTGNSQN